MAYRVEFSPAARRSLDRLHGIAPIAVRGVIRGLAVNPRPAGSTKLVGTRSTWRVRVRIDGEAWRVIYQIDDASQLVIIARVVRRDEGTYRSL
jgi:mRNA interferase RelE/StbE